MESEYFDSNDLIELGVKFVGENVRISKDSVIVGLDNISIGSNVRVDSYNTILAGRNELIIGSNVHIEPHSSIICHFGVRIGNFCTISHGVRLFTASANYSGEFFTNVFPDPKFQQPIAGSITLEDHVIIGANSVVMPGVRIGEGAAVGALSFVRKSLEPWQIYAGNPLRTIRERERSVKEIGDSLLGHVVDSFD